MHVEVLYKVTDDGIIHAYFSVEDAYKFSVLIGMSGYCKNDYKQNDSLLHFIGVINTNISIFSIFPIRIVFMNKFCLKKMKMSTRSYTITTEFVLLGILDNPEL